MLDKITLINLVWMVMVGAMLTATVTLSSTNNVQAAKNGVTEVTARSYTLGQY